MDLTNILKAAYTLPGARQEDESGVVDVHLHLLAEQAEDALDRCDAFCRPRRRSFYD